MSSVNKLYAQNASRRLVVTQGEQGAYFYNMMDIDRWYEANQSKVTKIGSMYLINGTDNGSSFIDVLLGNSGASPLNHTNSRISERKSVKDMGKELYIGTSAEPRLLVLRQVQSYSSSATSRAGDGTNPNYNGYVVVENNCNDLQHNNGRFTVRVARI